MNQKTPMCSSELRFWKVSQGISYSTLLTGIPWKLTCLAPLQRIKVLEIPSNWNLGTQPLEGLRIPFDLPDNSKVRKQIPVIVLSVDIENCYCRLFHTCTSERRDAHCVCPAEEGSRQASPAHAHGFLRRAS